MAACATTPCSQSWISQVRAGRGRPRVAQAPLRCHAPAGNGLTGMPRGFTANCIEEEGATALASAMQARKQFDGSWRHCALEEVILDCESAHPPLPSSSLPPVRVDV